MARVEHHMDLKQKKLAKIDEMMVKECTFKPSTYSK